MALGLQGVHYTLGMSTTTPRYVEVVWHDAWATPTEEVELEKAYTRNKSVPYRTRGWLLSEGVDGLLLAPEQNLEEKDHYRGPMHIPAAMVRSVSDFPPKRVRKKKVNDEPTEVS